MGAAGFPIGVLSAETGVNIETIRYYERIGLMPSPPRTKGRQRLYDGDHLKRLSFIRRSRQLGFSLDDIRTLLGLSDDADIACADTREMTLRHLADIRGKIASLRKLERALKSMTDACQPGNQRSCPILDTLNATR